MALDWKADSVGNLKATYRKVNFRISPSIRGGCFLDIFFTDGDGCNCELCESIEQAQKRAEAYLTIFVSDPLGGHRL